MKTGLRVCVGLAFWCLLLAALWRATWSDSHDRARTARWSEQIRDYSAGRRTTLELKFPATRELAIGDPIFLETADGTLRQIGEIAALRQGSQTLPARQALVREALAELYPQAPPLSPDAELTYIATPDSLAWVVQKLLPDEKRAQIAAELSTVLAEHREEILAALRPLAEQSLRDSLAVIEQDLPAALARHRAELEAIGARYHTEIVEAEVVPLVQDEVWPIVRRHGEPVAAEVGSQLWERVSLWRFGWRVMYDRSFLPDKQLAEKELQRFTDEEAIPILRAHADDFLAVIENSLKDTARNPRVRAALRRNLVKIMEDPELQAVLGTIFREVIVDNPRLREALERNWTSPQAQAAFQLAGRRLEPAVRRMGDLVFGTPEEGISPEFAAALRNQILRKDRRCLLLRDRGEPAAGPFAPPPRSMLVKLPQREAPPRMIGAQLPRRAE